jgi:hypothetical protein
LFQREAHDFKNILDYYYISKMWLNKHVEISCSDIGKTEKKAPEAERMCHQGN